MSAKVRKAKWMPAVLMLASWQLLGCGPEEVDESQENRVEVGSSDKSDSEVDALGSGSNWICYGESTHTIDVANNLVIWRFYTQNNSTKLKKQALVIGRVWHTQGGGYLECSANDNVGSNTCFIQTPLGSGYEYSSGQHRCCERKNVFADFKCAETSSGDEL